VVGGNGGSGGGLTSAGPSMKITIRNSTFMRNRGTSGGAIYAYWSSGPTIINSRFIGNRATNGGAIFSNWSSEPTVYGSLFVGNSATGTGGALEIQWSDTANIINSTFASNSAPSGGAISLDSRADASIVNGVFWANGSKPLNGTAFVTSYSCLELGALGTGNVTLTADPFADLDGADAVAGNLDDDLHLKPAHACLNSGSNAAVPSALTVDLDGKARIQGTVDRGAYETP
jgi:predicted outer membrane repeat protein